MAGDHPENGEMKKLLYVCEADSGGIMEYAIRQSAALARAGLEVVFLCKPSFPEERLAEGINVEILKSGKADALNNSRWLVVKAARLVKMISDLRVHSKQVAELAERLAYSPSSVELTTKDAKKHETGKIIDGKIIRTTEEEAGLRLAGQAGASESDSLASELADLPVSESLNRSTIGTASEFSPRNQLLATSNHLGEAEVCVLFACYKEYFAPFWVGPLRRLAKRGFVIGTIAHDPVRDFVVGPLWWHRWSVRLGYSFVRHVFVHDDTPVDFGGKRPDGIQVHEIPHGPYEVAEPKIGREAMRRKLGFATTKDTNAHEKVKAELTTEFTESTEGEAGPFFDKPSGAAFSNPSTSEIARDSENTSLTRSASIPVSSPATSYHLPATPASPDVVFLAFGQIRDGKNLDLFLQAMTRLPENVKLLVAGKGDSRSSKPPEFYQKLAEDLGVADRCRWDIRRIPEEEVGDVFATCDVVLLTYSAKFRSASGVLNAAVSARKPVLASSGAGPLKNVVSKYQLGVFVEPDKPEEILRGAKQLLDSLSPPATQNLDARYLRLYTCSPPTTSDSLPVTRGAFSLVWDRYECENSWDENTKKIRNIFVPPH